MSRDNSAKTNAPVGGKRHTVASVGSSGPSRGELAERDLDKVSGGTGTAGPSTSWTHDDESPKET